MPWFARIGSVELRERIPEATLSQIWSLGNIKTLSLYGKGFSDKDLNQLPGLTFLTLNQTEVTDHGLEHLRQATALRGLSLDSTPVTDGGLKHLQGLTGLTYLNLEHTHTSAAGRANLRKALPHCTITDQ